jgi:hypothetical protein
VNLFSHGLEFPQGYAPGFDSGHSAARNPRYSGIATGNAFVNLLSGKASVVTGAITAGKDVIGPVAVSPASGTAYNSIPNSFADTTPSGATVAGIFTIQSSPANSNLLIGTNVTNAITAIYLSFTSLIFAVFYNNVTVSSGFVPALNTPYFYAASINSGVGVNFVLVNLHTGQTKSINVAQATAIGTQGAVNYCIGGNTNGTNGGLSVAAAMYSSTYLSMSQMLVWAQDPWGFWYPPNVMDMMIFSRAPAVPRVYYKRFNVALRR